MALIRRERAERVSVWCLHVLARPVTETKEIHVFRIVPWGRWNLKMEDVAPQNSHHFHFHIPAPHTFLHLVPGSPTPSKVPGVDDTRGAAFGRASQNEPCMKPNPSMIVIALLGKN